jgi:hypothetical protein
VTLRPDGGLPDRYRVGAEHNVTAPVVTSGPGVLFDPEDFARLDNDFPSKLLHHRSRRETITDQKTYSVRRVALAAPVLAGRPSNGLRAEDR